MTIKKFNHLQLATKLEWSKQYNCMVLSANLMEIKMDGEICKTGCNVNTILYPVDNTSTVYDYFMVDSNKYSVTCGVASDDIEVNSMITRFRSNTILNTAKFINIFDSMSEAVDYISRICDIYEITDDDLYDDKSNDDDDKPSDNCYCDHDTEYNKNDNDEPTEDRELLFKNSIL